MPRIIYIMGCGRSGTTLLGIALGHANGFLDVGEFVDYAKFRGQPNGFAPESNNAKFWRDVNALTAEKDPDVDFEELTYISDRLEWHQWFVLNYLGLANRGIADRYGTFLRSLIGAVEKVSEGDIIVDSSKYPGRAVLLSKIFKDDLCIVYVKRNPIGVINAFKKEGIRAKTKGFWSANLYYFVINAFCAMVKIRTPKTNFFELNYEDFINDPTGVLEALQSHFSIDLSRTIDTIRNGDPLFVGYPINGNRIRLEESVVLKQSDVEYPSSFANSVSRLLNVLWY